MPRQPGGPGTGMSQQEQYNHKENLAGVGSAGPTAAAGNAEETPLPEGQEKTQILGASLKSFALLLIRLGFLK